LELVSFWTFSIVRHSIWTQCFRNLAIFCPEIKDGKEPA
jgi:hypothetical protein